MKVEIILRRDFRIQIVMLGNRRIDNSSALRYCGEESFGYAKILLLTNQPANEPQTYFILNNTIFFSNVRGSMTHTYYIRAYMHT
jgi:hypothetical protein